MQVPAIVKPIVDAAKPAAISLGVVGAGALAAQAGSAIAKKFSADLEAFAARSVWHEAAVDAGAGVVVDAGIVAAAAAVKGPELAKAIAPLLLIGTGVSALAPAVVPYFNRAVDAAVNLVGGPSTSQAALTAPAQAPKGGALMAPGGFDFNDSPGGFDFGASADPGGMTFGLFDEVNLSAVPSSLGA